ncbi:D-serine deaminase, pyridoxal phosphate-dependent [Catalinimonas alkaloidigena]|uniref:D-serine deaminase, pyridoxal phosphate-dependent n=1 Tax=Catalinimonas alkaloidigena TaxID=1075417 RepID=A0A1G9LW68_9BACT|nr:D-TA family PLP-dependent enzyme [Catalinimonas alkaloidigena]SDL65675.1 D-serine deaminase, pyridoxal phosphate-dependent [Catalinimonas alkaloidigena]
MTEWYPIANAEAVDSPALLVYADRVRANIRVAIGMVGDVNRLRPHVKTHKMAEVARMMMDESIRKFKCATIAEAEMLALVQAPDVLLAYQPIGPKIDRLRKLVEQYPDTQFACLVDNVAAARALAVAFYEAGQTLPVLLDLNVGQNRTGIVPENALALYQACAELEGIAPVGLHAYDGHLRDPDLAVRQQQCDEGFVRVKTLVDQLTAQEFAAPVVVAGGSPSFPIHARRDGVEASPGTFIFWDWGYRTILPEQPFQFAALVLTRVISRIDATTLCLDLGHKSIAAENPFPRVKFLNAPDAQPVSQSEEHLVVQVEATSPYRVGDVFYGVPIHICPTVALYDTAQIVQNGRVEDHWRVVARDRFIHI